MSELQRPSSYERTICRACRWSRTEDKTPVLRLPGTPLANSFCRSREEALQLPKFPLDVYACARCGHHQLGTVVSAHAMFSDYAYASGTSESFRKHFDGYAHRIMVSRPGQRVLELGSNDGTMMKALLKYGAQSVIGVEPAANLAQRCTAEGLDVINGFFNQGMVRQHNLKADLWTANNVLAHIDDFIPTLDALALTGARGGVFEIQYLGSLLKGGLFDMIYHEHLDYWRLMELVNELHRHTPWTVWDVELVPTHGGSLRVWVERAEDGQQARLMKGAAELYSREAATHWPLEWKKLKELMSEERERICGSLRSKKSIAVFGAPAKLTTLMYGLELQDLNFAYVVDDSPLKQGLYTPGTGLLVVAEHELKHSPPDAVLIGAWNFAGPIKDRLANLLPSDVPVVTPFSP